MQRHNSLHHCELSTSLNNPVLDVISELDGVKPENIYLANGSGPILKQCIPHLVRSKIKSGPSKYSNIWCPKRFSYRYRTTDVF